MPNGSWPISWKVWSASSLMSIVSDGDAQMFHQCQGIGPGALGGAEAGHRQAVDQPAVEAEHVAGRRPRPEARAWNRGRPRCRY